MKINFKLAALGEVLDENEYLMDASAYTEDKEDYTYNLWLFRVVIPELHLAFRTGDAYVRNPEVDDPDNPDAYEYIAGATVIYKDGETDFNNYVYAIAIGESFAIYTYCRENSIACRDDSELDCYIEIDELMH